MLVRFSPNHIINTKRINWVSKISDNSLTVHVEGNIIRLDMTMDEFLRKANGERQFA